MTIHFTISEDGESYSWTPLWEHIDPPSELCYVIKHFKLALDAADFEDYNFPSMLKPHFKEKIVPVRATRKDKGKRKSA